MSIPTYKKRFGQHHLRDVALCRPLVRFLGPAGRLTLEIGPGGGVLTRALLAARARVIACEIDPEWAFALAAKRLGGALRIAVANALDLEWERLPPGARVAGNLPYNVATTLIERLLRRASGVERAGFLVQLEVARRLVAAPGSADYGSLSVLVAARAEPRLLARVRRASFRPAPAVDGAFVGLLRRRPPLPAAEMESFDATVRLAFAQRRKTLRNALAAGWGREATDDLLSGLGLGPRTRAATLGVAEFVELHRAAREAGLARPAGDRG